MLAATSPLGHTVHTRYDRAGRRVLTFDHSPEAASGPDRRTQFAYDRMGRLIATTDADGFVTRQTYDALGRIVATNTPDPDGDGPLSRAVVRTGYDLAGAAIWQRDALGRITETQLDGRGRVVRVLAPAPDATTPNVRPVAETIYDDKGQVIAERHLWRNDDYRNPLADWVTTSYGYDTFGRRTTTIADDHDGPAGGTLGNAARITTTLTYDDGDRVVSQQQTAANWLTGGLETRLSMSEYDALDRVVRTVGPDPDGAGPLVGAITENEYDAVGDLIAQRTLFDIVDGDPIWAESRHTYDAFGRRTRTVAPHPDPASSDLGPITDTGYDKSGNVLWTKDPLGRVVRHRYDARGQRVATATPQWQSTVTAANGSIRPVDASEPAVRTRYDRLGRVVAVIDAAGRTVTTEYDALGRVVQVTQPDPDGSGPLPAAFVRTTYDAAGNVVATSDHLGRTTVSRYDDLNRVVSVSTPHASDPALDGTLAAPTTTREYDLAGNVVATVDAIGVRRTFTFNRFGAPVRETLPANADGVVTFLEFEYDSWGNRTVERTRTDAGRDGQARQFQTLRHYDLLGRETHAIGPDPDGSGRTAAAAIAATTSIASNGTWGDELPPETIRLYAQNGQLREVKTRQQVADRDGLVTSTFVTTTSEYDRLGRLITETQPTDVEGCSAVIRCEYDAAGQLTGHIDPSGVRTTFRYDRFGNVWQEVDGLGNARTSTFDAAGQLLTRTLATGQQARFVRDGLGRIISEDWYTAASLFDRSITTTYNAAGLPFVLTTDDTRQLHYYDRLDRLTKEYVRHQGDLAAPDGTLPQSLTIKGYDAAGRVTYTQRRDAHNTRAYESHVYDDLGQVVLVVHSGSHDAGVANKRVTTTYDFAGRMLSLARDGEGSPVWTGYAYDAAGRLDQIWHRWNTLDGFSGQTTSRTFYAQDAAGLVVGRQDELGVRTHFLHNGSGQLILEDHPGAAADVAYFYDAAGNRIATGGYGENARPLGTFVYEPGSNRLLEDADFTYAYDAEGRLTSRTAKRSGGQGQTAFVVGDRSVYVWDVRGRLERVVTYRADGSLDDVRYDYDASDRRVARRAYQASAAGQPWSLTGYRRFTHDGPADSAQVTAIADATGRTLSRTLLSPETDRLLAVDATAEATGATPITAPAALWSGPAAWLLADAQGSVRHVLGDVAGQMATVGSSVEYTAFGGLLSRGGFGGVAGQGPTALYGYTGQLWDPAAGLGGLYHYRARWYDTSSGRFVSRDPAGLAAGDANLYRYVGNQPTSATDPSGKFLKKLFKKLAKAFGKLFDKLFSEKIQKFVRPVLAVVGALVIPGIGAKLGALVGKAIGSRLAKLGVGAAVAGKVQTAAQIGVGGLQSSGVPAALAAKGSVGWATAVGGLSTPSLTGVTLGAFNTGIGATDPFSQILTGAVSGYRSGGAWQGTAVSNVLGGGVRPGWAGALYGGGVAALGQSGGSLTTVSEIAGGSLGFSLAPGVSIGFSLPGALAHRQKAQHAQLAQQRRAAEARKQRTTAQASPVQTAANERANPNESWRTSVLLADNSPDLVDENGHQSPLGQAVLATYRSNGVDCRRCGGHAEKAPDYSLLPEGLDTRERPDNDSPQESAPTPAERLSAAGSLPIEDTPYFQMAKKEYADDLMREEQGGLSGERERFFRIQSENDEARRRSLQSRQTVTPSEVVSDRIRSRAIELRTLDEDRVYGSVEAGDPTAHALANLDAEFADRDFTDPTVQFDYHNRRGRITGDMTHRNMIVAGALVDAAGAFVAVRGASGGTSVKPPATRGQMAIVEPAARPSGPRPSEPSGSASQRARPSRETPDSQKSTTANHREQSNLGRSSDSGREGTRQLIWSQDAPASATSQEAIVREATKAANPAQQPSATNASKVSTESFVAKNGETQSTVVGKQVHTQQADIRRRSGEFDLVESAIRRSDGTPVLVPKRVDLTTGRPAIDSPLQEAIPDAVSFGRRLVVDDKPVGRPIAKDRQEIIRFIRAYEQREGRLPDTIAVQRYDPQTGEPVVTELYAPSDFLPGD